MILRALFLCYFISTTFVGWGQQILGFVIEDGKKKVQIPFELYNNLIVVPILLNETLPLKFVVDTGVQTAILTQKAFSDILNLPYSRKYTISGPGGIKLIDAYVTHNVSLRLPGVHGTGHALLVLEEDYLELRNYLGTDVHGVLGYELFSRFIVQIDYEKKVLTIYNPDKFRRKKKFNELPIRVEDTKPYIHVNTVLTDSTSIQAKLLIDTGASHGIMLETSSDTRIKMPEPGVSSIIGRGIGGEITGRVGRIHSISIGPYVLQDVIANFPDPNSYMDSLKIGRTKRNGALGGEILSRFTIVVDFAKERIFLKKNSSFKKKFYYNLSGLTIRAKGSRLNVFEITEVRENTAAQKAGIVQGDLIHSINGQLTSTMTLHHVIGLFNSRPGKKMTVEIKRGNLIVKKRFALESQI